MGSPAVFHVRRLAELTRRVHPLMLTVREAVWLIAVRGYPRAPGIGGRVLSGYDVWFTVLREPGLVVPADTRGE